MSPAMAIPTEPIGSIPRPVRLIEAVAKEGGDHPKLNPLYEDAVRETVREFEADLQALRASSGGGAS